MTALYAILTAHDDSSMGSVVAGIFSTQTAAEAELQKLEQRDIMHTAGAAWSEVVELELDTPVELDEDDE